MHCIVPSDSFAWNAVRVCVRVVNAKGNGEVKGVVGQGAVCLRTAVVATVGETWSATGCAFAVNIELEPCGHVSMLGTLAPDPDPAEILTPAGPTTIPSSGMTDVAPIIVGPGMALASGGSAPVGVGPIAGGPSLPPRSEVEEDDGDNELRPEGMHRGISNASVESVEF